MPVLGGEVPISQSLEGASSRSEAPSFEAPKTAPSQVDTPQQPEQLAPTQPVQGGQETFSAASLQPRKDFITEVLPGGLYYPVIEMLKERRKRQADADAERRSQLDQQVEQIQRDGLQQAA